MVKVTTIVGKQFWIEKANYLMILGMHIISCYERDHWKILVYKTFS